MNFSHVRAFKAVFELGTVTGAANYLHVTQPAISHLISALEDDLGFKLFDRVKGRLQCTDEGRSFYAEVDKVFSGLESLRQRGRAIRDQHTTGLTIAAMPLLSNNFIPLAVRQLRTEKKNQGFFRIMTYRSDEVADRVAMQTCDLGFSLAATNSPDVRCIRLLCQNVFLVPKSLWRWGRSQIVSLDQIGQLSLIRHERDIAQDALDRMLKEHGVFPISTIEVSFASTIAALVALGEGAAVVDPFTALAASQLNSTVITAKIKVDLPFAFYVLLPQRRPVSTSAIAFLRTVDHLSKDSKIDLHGQFLNGVGNTDGTDNSLSELIDFLESGKEVSLKLVDLR